VGKAWQGGFYGLRNFYSNSAQMRRASNREPATISARPERARNGKRFIACADEKMTAFSELEAAVRRADGHVSGEVLHDN